MDRVSAINIKRRKHEFNVRHLIDMLIISIPLILVTLLCFLPFIILISSSITNNEILTKSVQIVPKMITFDAYNYLFRYPEQIINSYLLTIGVTAAGVVLNLFLCLLLAYPISDPNYKYRKQVSFILFFTMLFSAGLIPTYIIIRRVLMLYDSFWVLVLYPLCIPGHVFMFMVFLRTVPSSLYESARIDGCNEFMVLFKIAVPCILPGLSVMTFHFVLLFWNDAFTALNFTDKYYPIALYIQRWQTYIDFLKRAGLGGSSVGGIIGSDGDIPDITVRFAMGVVSTLPLVIIFAFLQKYFIRGLTSGSVKG